MGLCPRMILPHNPLHRTPSALLQLTTQSAMIWQSKLAGLKTDLEMQDVRYARQTQEHKNFKAEIKHLRKQLQEWTAVKDTVSPRPDWKRLHNYLPGQLVRCSHCLSNTLSSNAHVHARRWILIYLCVRCHCRSLHEHNTEDTSALGTIGARFALQRIPPASFHLSSPQFPSQRRVGSDGDSACGAPGS